jgi:3D (Asp-Asp-Asp) domain-containing protein
MHPETGVARQGAPCVVILALALAVPGGAAGAGPSGCETRTMRVTFYTCAESSSRCLTRKGHQPIPFRTVAVGDAALLGRWLYVEDLGGWAFASDTGGALKANSLDVFIGEGRVAKRARRLGVQFWEVRVCAPAEVQGAGALQAAQRDSVATPGHDAGAPGGAPR